MTMWLAARLEAMLLLATLPAQLSPRGETDPQTSKSPLAYPPCPLSQVLRVPGLQFLPIPARAMATELIRHPALQIVLAEVPSCSLPHFASHCLQTGQVLEAATATSKATAKSLKFIAVEEIKYQYHSLLNQSHFISKKDKRFWLKLSFSLVFRLLAIFSNLIIFLTKMVTFLTLDYYWQSFSYCYPTKLVSQISK